MLIAGRFRLVGLLGRGGMGEVWRATDERLHRDVAVKLLSAIESQGTTSRFEREARTAARLNHPHIVSVYDFGRFDDRPYLVMELVDGRTLADQLSISGPPSIHRAAEIGAQTADGLAAAHALGVVHRDIKPANLLLARDGSVKVADFGIATLLLEGQTAITTTGHILGTGGYLAPERATGRSAGPAAAEAVNLFAATDPCYL
jgi:serine/threonine-protein kinase